ncbi:MAG: four helix bundle protein [Candidatus Peribacteraceae bacterium]|jgi:four helix bundle protein|nr:four helix bundle protein [Candidatus Peribacteraceae bacterium]HCI03930.1 four helix bundle protein [Candidatus Peribacteria bacterium]|tara:strand:+ start:6331 stop:6738 length:408 start_codon:yes stop_codon:yes gene_type:complete
MSTFKSFEDIEAWQESRKLVKSIRVICKLDNVKRDFAFVDQITRSARSISANIAEGSEALTYPDFIQYLGHARKSASEVRAHLYDARDEEYVSDQEFESLTEQTRYIGRMLTKLICYLQGLDQKQKRTVKKLATS